MLGLRSFKMLGTAEKTLIGEGYRLCKDDPAIIEKAKSESCRVYGHQCNANPQSLEKHGESESGWDFVDPSMICSGSVVGSHSMILAMGLGGFPTIVSVHVLSRLVFSHEDFRSVHCERSLYYDGSSCTLFMCPSLFHVHLRTRVG